jgi:hypothetical protein
MARERCDRKSGQNMGTPRRWFVNAELRRIEPASFPFNSSRWEVPHFPRFSGEGFELSAISLHMLFDLIVSLLRIGARCGTRAIPIPPDRVSAWTTTLCPGSHFDVESMAYGAVISVVSGSGERSGLKMTVLIDGEVAELTSRGFVSFGHHYGTLRLTTNSSETLTIVAAHVGEADSPCVEIRPAVHAAEIRALSAGDRICFVRTSLNSEGIFRGSLPDGAEMLLHSNGHLTHLAPFHRSPKESAVDALIIQSGRWDSGRSREANLAVKWSESKNIFNFTAVSSSAEARLYIPTGFIRIDLQPDEAAFPVHEESFLQDIGKALWEGSYGVWMVVDFLGIVCVSIMIYQILRDHAAIARTYNHLALALAILGFAVAIWTMFWPFLRMMGIFFVAVWAYLVINM